MVKRKAEYIEGDKARKNFEDAMRFAFRVPKDKAPKPGPKRRKPSGRDAS